MRYNTLGNSDIHVTPIAFGAWAIGGWMWGGADEQEARKAIRKSYELGMRTFDTAPAYGFGRSEELVGETLANYPRDSYQLLTKYGLNWQTPDGEFYFETINNEGQPTRMYKYAGAKKIMRECEDSLRRLRTDYIDLYQIHWHDPTTPISETMEAIAKLLKQGKIRAAGVCNYKVPWVEEALKYVNIVSNQIPYSMLNRTSESEIVPQALQKGMSIIPYSPLQRGILSGKIQPGHTFNQGDTRKDSVYYQHGNISRINTMLEQIRPIADGHGATLSQLVINWTTRQPGMDCVLIGARDEKQVNENASALSFTLTGEELQIIDRSLSQLELIRP